MKILLSSAKTMSFSNSYENYGNNPPFFIEKSNEIVNILKNLNKQGLMKLMKISEKLSEDTYTKFQNWNKCYKNIENSPAIFSFSGAVFEQINAKSLSNNDLVFSEKSLRIICGLYGIVKPMDTIMPYRLEMGTKLSIGINKNLYEFWENSLTNYLIEELENDKTPFIINLASNEFSKAIDFKQIQYPVITPVFKEIKNGKEKVVSFFAKQARGAMTNFIIKNKIENMDNLKSFTWNGYHFHSHDEINKSILFLKK